MCNLLLIVFSTFCSLSPVAGQSETVFEFNDGQVAFTSDAPLVPPAEFFRINRQFIIRLAAIAEMHAYSKSRVKLKLNPPCKLETIVSTERSPHFKRWLEGQ